MNYTLKKIDNKLWQRVKVMAVMQQTTIKQIIISLLTKAVERFEKK